MDNKRLIREKIKAELKSMDLKEKNKKNKLIREKVFSTREYRQADLIFSYISILWEVDTVQIIKESLNNGKQVCVPFISDYGKKEMKAVKLNSFSGFKKDRFGIYQPENLNPADKENIKLFLIPALAFDKNKNRIGRGEGYFDKFLKDIKNIPLFGLAYSFQILDLVPVDAHDIPVTKIISA